MISKKVKSAISMLLVTVLVGGITGCASDQGAKSTTISISGSTSVGPLMEKISEKYGSENSQISIEINQVGSSAGVKDVINGVSDIGMASRELKDAEKQEVKATIIAYDGIAIITNRNNPVSNLSMEQLKDIYTGQITNWKDIEGGEDKPIVVISREEGSGTRSAFQEIVGYKSEDLIANATISDGNGNVKSTVEGNENAIGFISFEYLDDEISKLSIDGVKPEVDSVISGNYKISRPFILATKEAELKEEANALIEYILSKDGQTLVEENKLIPVN